MLEETDYPRPAGIEVVDEMRMRVREACGNLGFSHQKTEAFIDSLLGKAREQVVDDMEKVTVENYKIRK